MKYLLCVIFESDSGSAADMAEGDVVEYLEVDLGSPVVHSCVRELEPIRYCPECGKKVKV